MAAVVGFCRFSFLGRGDWMRYRKDTPLSDEALLAEAADELYDPARLERRFRTFEAITLPSILGQTEQDFIFHVLTSTALPQPWLDRLTELCALAPNIHLTVADTPDLDAVTQPILDDLQARHGEVMQFRLDDDDAIATRYVELVHDYARRMSGIPTWAMTFTEGLMAGTYPGEPVWHGRYSRPFWGCAAIMKFETSHRSVLNVAHFGIKDRFTHIQDRSNMGCFILRWPSDSRPVHGNEKRDWLRFISEKRFDALCADHFPYLEGVDFARF